MKTTLIILASILTLTVSANINIAKLSERVVELRLEVEMLNSEYLALREEKINELKSIGGRLTHLSAQIEQEEIRKKQVKQKILVLKEQMSKIGATDNGLTPLVLEQVGKASLRVSNGIPFLKDKRLKDLKEIKGKLTSKVISPENALGRFWAHLEDEMRLTRENALHRQTIVLDGQERLATIAKLGMMMMYFHTTDNLVGYISKKDDGGYLYVEESNKERQDLIFKLIDGLQKQIRHGRYDLPLALN